MDLILQQFFDLIDVVCANRHVVYNMMHWNDLTLLNFKLTASTCLIGRYKSRSRASPDGKTSLRRKYKYQFEQGNLPPHLPRFQNVRRQCEYCYEEGIDLKTYVKYTVSFFVGKKVNKIILIKSIRKDDRWYVCVINKLALCH